MTRRLKSQHGFSLAEILVALAIFGLIFLAALAMYDQSNRIFKRGVESADTQQNVRVSFDKVVADVRMLGFDYDRDGIPTGSTSGIWAPTRTYGVGNLVTPTVANGFVYRMTPAAGGPNSCTSAAAQPIWPTAVGNFIGDNNCRWQALQGLNQYQQPDEQIEFAHPAALTVRGNFDFELRMAGDAENGREPSLESPEFPVVTTGNDEIVTYALRSDNGPNPHTIAFFADVQGRKAFVGAGGRPENLVRIPRVNLGVTTGTFGGRPCTPDDPCFADAPYTLYRFTLDENGAPVETPLASNIRSIALKYYNNVTGVPAATPPTGWASVTRVTDAGGGQFNPLAPSANLDPRNARSVIQSVRVTLVGMTEAQEPNFTNPLETTGPFKGYRTYRLESLVVPRNIGRQGMREIPPNPPGAPILQAVTFGYCGAVKVSWLAAVAGAGEGQVESYVIQYNTTGSTTVFPFLKDAGSATEGTVTGLDPNVNYTFTVAAVNSYGNQEALIPGTTNTAIITVQPQNRTTPGILPPAGGIGVGSGGGQPGAPAAQPNKVTVTFPSPADSAFGSLQQRLATGGTAVIAGTAPQLYGEIVRYKVYRSTTPTFTATDGAGGNEIQITAPNSLQITSGNVTFVDQTALNCIRYYYKFKPVEYCGEAACGAGCNTAGAAGEGTDSFPATGQPGIAAISTASADPASPATLRILESPDTPASRCTGPTCDIHLSWPRVDKDVEDPANTIVVSKYRVTRKRFLNGVVDVDRGGDGPAVVTIDYDDPTPSANSNIVYSQNNLPARQGGNDYEYVYSVRALQCPDGATPPVYRESAPSPEAKFPCSFETTTPTLDVTFRMDGDGSSPATAWLTNNPASTVVVTVADATKISSIQAVLDSGSGDVIDLGTQTRPPFSFPLVDTQVGQVYQLLVIAKDTKGCSRTVTGWVEEATATGCCLAAFANDLSVVRYTPGTNFVDVALKNLCGQPLDLQTNGIQFTWDPAIAGNTTTTTLTTIQFPSTATGSATLTLNDTAAIGATAPRLRIVSAPTATTPPARTTVAADDTNYVIRFNFDKVLTNTSSPITKACIVYRRTIDTTDQSCQIIPQPPSFNVCN